MSDDGLAKPWASGRAVGVALALLSHGTSYTTTNWSKAGLPSTSANAAVKTQKEEKAKKEKPNAVGTFELVKYLIFILYLALSQIITDSCNSTFYVYIYLVTAGSFRIRTW